MLIANDIAEASRQLRSDGKVIINLHEDSDAPAITISVRDKKVTRDDIIYFATQLAVMVDTGVPISEALDIIGDQSDHSGLRKMVKNISEQVKSGIEFSKALEAYPQCFSRLFVAMMRASEASGTMGTMLQRVCDYMGQERETVKQIKGAMIYPICMLTFCVVVVVALLVFVLPKFEKIYTSKGAALPLPTSILLGISNGLRDNWIVIVILLGAGIIAARFFLRSTTGKIFMDKVKIYLPMFGQMYRKAYIARSMRTMSTMITTGVNMLDGLRITGEVAGNYFYEKIWMEISNKIKEGSSMSDELMKCSLVPRTVSQMISAGERSGKLGQVMNRIAEFCEADLKVSIKTLTSMIEPLMIIVMGCVIGGIAMALLLPIFSISKVVAR